MTATPRTPIRLLIYGASGRMGGALLRLAAAREDLRVTAAVAESPKAETTPTGVPLFAAGTPAGALPAFDVVIDFSLPAGFDAALALCRERGAALVSGTTGLHASQRAALHAAGAEIPALWSANYSLGVAVMKTLVARAAAALPGWDCDIVESHHVHKLDAPSGTALALGAVAEQAGAVPRYASLRAGDIVGEHLVQFTAPGERIELTHRATDRDIFARGALHAAALLAGKPPGEYSFEQLLAASMD